MRILYARPWLSIATDKLGVSGGARAIALVFLAAAVIVNPAAAASKAIHLHPGDIHLASVNAAVADFDTGEILYSKNAERVVPIASITKLMTAMVVLDSDAPMDEWLTVLQWEAPAPTNAYSRMRVGSSLPRADLLRLALMSSENRAAYNLGRHHPDGLNAFVAAMNRKAAELGMTQTHFVDSSGLSPENRSTAADLLKLVKAADGYPRIHEYTSAKNYVARFRNPSHQLSYWNTNVLVQRGDWDISVSKTGYLNEAGRCLVMLTEIGDRKIALALLDSFGKRTPVGDVGRIKQWLQTGSSGPVAGAALTYEQQKSAHIEPRRVGALQH